MSTAKCIAAMTRAVGRELATAEMTAIVERLENKMAGKRRERGAKTDGQLYRAALAELREEVAMAKAQARRSRLLNIEADAKVDRRVEAAVGAGLSPEHGLLSLGGGVNTPFPGSREGVDQTGKTLFRLYAEKGILAGLRREGPEFVDLFRARDMQKPIGRELWELSLEADPVRKGEAKVGATGDERALKIARIVRQAQERARLDENAAGSWRGATPGYVFAQGWDSRRAYKIGAAEFQNDFLPRLREEVFERDQTRLDRLEGEQIAASFEWMAEVSIVRNRIDQLRSAADPRMRRALDTLGAAPEKMAALETAAKGLAGAFKEAPPDIATLQKISKGLADARRWIGVAADRAKKRAGTLDLETKRIVDEAERASDAMRAAEARMLAAADARQGLQGRADDRGAFLKAVYDDIVTDRWRASEGARADFDGNLPFVGPGNLAEKISRHRVLLFKTFEDFWAMHLKYGRGGVADNVLQDLEHQARNTGLMQWLGTNPEAMWQKKRQELADKYHGQPQAVGGLLGKELDWLYAEISGRTRTIAHGKRTSWAAAFWSGVRNWTGASKLGYMLISSFSDIATHAGELRFQGKGFLSSYKSAILDSASFMVSRQDRLAFAELTGVGSETWLGTVMARVNSNDGVPGTMAGLMQAIYRLTGTAVWSDGHQAAAAATTARHFAMQRGTAFPALHEADRRLLSLYNIGEREWDVIRRAGLDRVKRRDYLTSDGIDRLELEAFMGLAGSEPRDLMRAQQELGMRWRMMMLDRADHAVPTPGARERALLNMGTQRGDRLGEALRLIAQFKGFPLTVAMKVLGRDAHGRGAQSSVLHLAETILMMTAFGYLSMSSKDLLRGYGLRDPLNPKTLAAAMAQGGGLGLYGDFLFGEYNRFGRSALETVAGPTAGTIADGIKLFAELRSADRGKELDKAGAHAVRMAMANVPFANLAYVRPVLDYLILWRIQEALSPGTIRRAEQQRRKDYGQERVWQPLGR